MQVKLAREIADRRGTIIEVATKFVRGGKPELAHALIGAAGALDWVLERDREDHKERTREGLALARATGKRLGRPPLKVTPEEIRALRESPNALSFGKIAAKVGVSKSAVKRLYDRAVREEA